ncbi:MAG: SurA N-terminal domain-containing protein, partial [Atribacterota bacterium]
IIILVVTFVGTLFYGTYYRRSRGPVQPEAVAATVNDTPITYFELENQFRNFISQFDNKYLSQLDEKGIDYLRRMTLENMIDNQLLYQEAQSRNLKVSDQDVNMKLKEFEANFPSPEEFKKYLEYQYPQASMDDFKESLRRDLQTNVLVNSLNEGIQIPDADIQKYYNDNKQLLSIPNQYHLAQVTQITAEEADKIIKKLNLGEDFAATAKANSLDSTAKNGGDAGWIPENRLPQEAKDAIIALKDKPGAITSVIKTGSSFQIFKVMEFKPGQEKNLEESREQIKTILENEQKRVKLDHLVAELRQKSTITLAEAFNTTPSPSGSASLATSPSPASTVTGNSTPQASEIPAATSGQ